jgi:hypothetical protein
MKASSFTKSPYTFVPLQARIWHACTAICVMYILSGENITAVYTMSRRQWDQNTTQVANRLDWAWAIYVWLLHLTPWWSCMYAWNNKREENHICFAVIWFAPPLFPLLASKGKHVPALWVRENERGSHCGCISCGGEGGRTHIRWQARKIWDLPLLYSLLNIMCSVCRRGGCVQYTCIGGEGGPDK